MKTILFIFLFFSFSSTQENFYQVFSNNSLVEINESLNVLEKIKGKTIIEEAYIAALTMKKSGFEKDLKIKIKTFKLGGLKLEELIESNPKNIELRFIRLIIQENSPKILKYNTNLLDDKNFIIKNYIHQTKNLQKHILKYAEKSKIIDTNHFNE